MCKLSALVETCISLINKIIDTIIDRQQDPKIILATNMVFEKFKSGDVKINIFKKYKLEEASKAHEDLESRKITGPVVIIPN